MSGLTFKLDGRTVNRSQFVDGMMGKVRQAAVEKVRETVESTRCPEHGQRARLSQVEWRGEGFSAKVTGCCDAVVKKAQAKIGG